MFGFYLQQSLPDTGELTFIAEESEDGRSEQHRLPELELRSLPMIERGHRRERADKKETDLANTEKDMTQYDPVTKPDVGLKTPSVPIRRLHYYKTQHRDGKVPGRNPPRPLWQSTPGNQEAHPRKTPELRQPVR